MTPEEALRGYWSAACDCDPVDHDACEEGGDLFDAWEAAGLIRPRAVTKADLDDAFAAEKGIAPAGSMWELTPAGLDALQKEVGR
jgi:hypothetical protein